MRALVGIIDMHAFILSILLPERPLIDNNLTFNYTPSNILAFMVFPLLVLILLKSDISLKKFVDFDFRNQ